METVLKSEIHEFLANLFEALEPRRSLQGEFLLSSDATHAPEGKQK